MHRFMKFSAFINTIIISLLFLLVSNADYSLYAQTTSQPLKAIEKLVQKQGDLFIAVDYPKPGPDKFCLEENSFSNQIQFKGDSAFLNFINYTELFCETYVLRTQYIYHFNLKDLDSQTIRLVEKRYDYGNGTLKEGPATWFEVQLFTRGQKPSIRKRELETRQTEFTDTVSILFKSKEGAKEALALFKNAISEITRF